MPGDKDLHLVNAAAVQHGARRVFNTVHGSCSTRCTVSVQHGARRVFNMVHGECLTVNTSGGRHGAFFVKIAEILEKLLTPVDLWVNICYYGRSYAVGWEKILDKSASGRIHGADTGLDPYHAYRQESRCPGEPGGSHRPDRRLPAAHRHKSGIIALKRITLI